nr:MAG TPA: hypothetical protein [Caudoviricetes sp.]
MDKSVDNLNVNLWIFLFCVNVLYMVLYYSPLCIN